MNRGGVNLFSTSDRIAILITRPLERAWVDIRNVDSFREIERLIDKIQTQKKQILIVADSPHLHIGLLYRPRSRKITLWVDRVNTRPSFFSLETKFATIIELHRSFMNVKNNEDKKLAVCVANKLLRSRHRFQPECDTKRSFLSQFEFLIYLKFPPELAIIIMKYRTSLV